MNQKKPCKLCQQFGHYPYKCRLNPKKPKSIKRLSRRGLIYKQWRDDVAKPYLIAKDGYKCALCGSTDRKLDIDHIAKRRMGGAPSRTMNINNVRFLCRPCHIDIT
jgi:5-methylcytosine-specific restriction endonuclease McrA